MKLFFEIQIVDECDKVHGRIRREIIKEAAYIGNRAVDEMRAGVAPGGMDGVVRMMQVRELRKNLLASEAKRCGLLLAEHLEDREGWHGLDRQERTENHLRGVAR